MGRVAGGARREARKASSTSLVMVGAGVVMPDRGRVEREGGDFKGGLRRGEGAGLGGALRSLRRKWRAGEGWRREKERETRLCERACSPGSARLDGVGGQ